MNSKKLKEFVKFLNSNKNAKEYLFSILADKKSESYYKCAYSALKFYYDANNNLNEFKNYLDGKEFDGSIIQSTNQNQEKL